MALQLTGELKASWVIVVWSSLPAGPRKVPPMNPELWQVVLDLLTRISWPKPDPAAPWIWISAPAKCSQRCRGENESGRPGHRVPPGRSGSAYLGLRYLPLRTSSRKVHDLCAHRSLQKSRSLEELKRGTHQAYRGRASATARPASRRTTRRGASAGSSAPCDRRRSGRGADAEPYGKRLRRRWHVRGDGVADEDERLAGDRA